MTTCTSLQWRLEILVLKHLSFYITGCQRDHYIATMSGAVCWIILFYAVSEFINEISASLSQCHVSRVSVDGHLEVVVDCTATSLSTIPVDSFPEDTTNLVLNNLKIQAIPDNAFAQLSHLRRLDLSNNDIRMLCNGSFRGLSKLKTLNLNENTVSIVESGVFSELRSLETLLMANRQGKLLVFEHAKAFKNLRILSLAMFADTRVARRYSLLPKLEVLDFFGGNTHTINITLMDQFRSLNISSVAFRNQHIHSIEPGAFSNFTNLRSINLCCNERLGYKMAVAALQHTQNTIIDTVVLDRVCKGGRIFNIFRMSDFCFPVGLNIRRLSVRSNAIIGIEANQAQCLSLLEELDLSYNQLIYIGPRNTPRRELATYLTYSLPKLCSVSASMNRGYYLRYCGNSNAALNYDVNIYFSTYSKCLPLRSIDDGSPYRTQRQELCPRGVEPEERMKILIPPSLQTFRIEHWRSRYRVSARRSIVFNSDNNLRYINLSYVALPIVISASYYGLHRLEMLDLSHCNIRGLTPKCVYFPSLKNLNISHNKLDTKLRQFCIGCPMLETFDISYNRYNKIGSLEFSDCKNLKHININGNPIQDLYLKLSSLTHLETLLLRSTKLYDLRRKFTAELDNLFRVKRFTLDIRNNTFVCACNTIAFVRWIQTTNVDITGRDELTCLLDFQLKLIVDVSLTDLTDECSGHVRVIIVCAVVVFIGVVVVTIVLVWNRWYIKYRIIMCNLSFRSKRRAERTTEYDAMVLYFAYPNKETDSAASRVIATWVLRHLRPLAEDEEGLRLYIDDRDGTSMTKAELFISAFEHSSKVIVCITPEFLKDESCLYNVHLALASKKPLWQFIFVNFCGENQHISSKQLRHFMRAKTAATYIVWTENEDDHNDFWRRMRAALNRRSADNGCGSLLGRTTHLSDTVSWRELEQMNLH